MKEHVMTESQEGQGGMLGGGVSWKGSWELFFRDIDDTAASLRTTGKAAAMILASG